MSGEKGIKWRAPFHERRSPQGLADPKPGGYYIVNEDGSEVGPFETCPSDKPEEDLGRDLRALIAEARIKGCTWAQIALELHAAEQEARAEIAVAPLEAEELLRSMETPIQFWAENPRAASREVDR